MTTDILETFSASFDDSQYPQELLQKYELMECLSHNETGETFLAREKSTGEFFIAKCYSRQSHISTVIQGSLLKEVRHAGLPVLAGEYQNDGMYCVVRRYIPGKTLEEFVRDTPVNRERFLSIALQLCDILAFLHNQNPPVIHRDIKPQNVIIDDLGKLTLIDFGISRSIKETAGVDTICFGTRKYAPPEQYGFAQTDHRSDIYSLGVLLGWLLTGHTDLQGSEDDPRKVPLVKVIKKCTAFDPRDRYRNVDEFRNALLGKTLRSKIPLFAGVAVVLLAGFFLINGFMFQPGTPAGITFKEPLIEQAVRLHLGINNAEPITTEDLQMVDELFIIGDRVAINDAEYQTLVNQYATEAGPFRRGNISTLNDLTKLKHLRRISLSDQNITDLTPLAQLQHLQQVDLRHNPVTDVSPLSANSALTTLTLFDTGVSDLTSLKDCYRLISLDIGYTPVESLSALEGLEGLQFLSMAKSQVKSLDQIHLFPLLEEIHLSDTPVQDLSPLLKLSRLRAITISENMRSAAETIDQQAGFSIKYP